MRHLQYCLITAHDDKESRHPQKVMKELGISYEHATPQSLADQWWFWNCENIPDDLPDFITTLEAIPIDCIGYGLSREWAERLTVDGK